MYISKCNMESHRLWGGNSVISFSRCASSIRIRLMLCVRLQLINFCCCLWQVLFDPDGLHLVNVDCCLLILGLTLYLRLFFSPFVGIILSHSYQLLFQAMNFDWAWVVVTVHPFGSEIRWSHVQLSDTILAFFVLNCAEIRLNLWRIGRWLQIRFISFKYQRVPRFDLNYGIFIILGHDWDWPRSLFGDLLTLTGNSFCCVLVGIENIIRLPI